MLNFKTVKEKYYYKFKGCRYIEFEVQGIDNL